MTEPRIPEPESLPHLTQKALIVNWDTASNEVWIDSSGLSCFDVEGLLRVALDLAEMSLPTEALYEDTEENE